MSETRTERIRRLSRKVGICPDALIGSKHPDLDLEADEATCESYLRKIAGRAGIEMSGAQFLTEVIEGTHQPRDQLQTEDFVSAISEEYGR